MADSATTDSSPFPTASPPTHLGPGPGQQLAVVPPTVPATPTADNVPTPPSHDTLPGTPLGHVIPEPEGGEDADADSDQQLYDINDAIAAVDNAYEGTNINIKVGDLGWDKTMAYGQVRILDDRIWRPIMLSFELYPPSQPVPVLVLKRSSMFPPGKGSNVLRSPRPLPRTLSRGRDRCHTATVTTAYPCRTPLQTGSTPSSGASTSPRLLSSGASPTSPLTKEFHCRSCRSGCGRSTPRS